MRGMNRKTGKALSGIEHLKQSIEDILTTPIGSRVERRDYGARLFELIDRPVNAAWFVDAYAWTAEALDTWEHRFSLSRVQVVSVDAGHPVLDLYGVYKPDGKPIKLEGVLV